MRLGVRHPTLTVSHAAAQARRAQIKAWATGIADVLLS